MLRTCATAALAAVLGVAAPALADDDPNCPPGTEPTVVTEVVHDNHESLPEPLPELVHDAEPVTCV